MLLPPLKVNAPHSSAFSSEKFLAIDLEEIGVGEIGRAIYLPLP
jgi:hypothetical protein